MSSDKIPLVTASVTTIARTEENQIPEGCVFLYPGIRKSNDVYTSPILSVHLYNRSASATQTDFAQAIVDNDPKHQSPAYHLGMVQSSRENNFSFNEQVLIIPVEDILSICYRTDTKKEIKIQTTSIPIRKSSKKDQGCCATFCCCCCDKAEGPEPDDRRDETVENKKAKRVIVITIEYLRYGRIDTPSHVRVLNENDRVSFYNSRMNVDTLQFYLLVSDEFDPIQFNLQRNQAETLACLITRIKQMAPQEYPSETQLQELVRIQVLEIFGVELKESSAITQSSTKNIPPITIQPTYTNDDGNSEFF